MKKINRMFLIFLVCISLGLSGCHNTKVINGIEYGTYGFLNKDTMQNPDINYEISIGSVIAAVIFCETIIVPLYVVLVDLYQPVSPKTGKEIKGQVI